MKMANYSLFLSTSNKLIFWENFSFSENGIISFKYWCLENIASGEDYEEDYWETEWRAVYVKYCISPLLLCKYKILAKPYSNPYHDFCNTESKNSNFIGLYLFNNALLNLLQI